MYTADSCAMTSLWKLSQPYFSGTRLEGALKGGHVMRKKRNSVPSPGLLTVSFQSAIKHQHCKERVIMARVQYSLKSIVSSIFTI